MEIKEIMAMIEQSSFFSQGILLLLLVMSVISWTIILAKFFLLNIDLYSSAIYAKKIAATSPNSQAHRLANQLPSNSPAALLYNSALRHFRSKETKSVQSLERNMEAEYFKLMSKFEQGLGLLALTSGSAPFIGLLGTVIGITITFKDIADKGVTSLAVVAPGISEALIATGAGLFVAIPALVGYNILQGRVRKLSNLLNAFQRHIINLFV